jgi:hypothetical protein
MKQAKVLRRFAPFCTVVEKKGRLAPIQIGEGAARHAEFRFVHDVLSLAYRHRHKGEPGGGEDDKDETPRLIENKPKIRKTQTNPASCRNREI